MTNNGLVYKIGQCTFNDTVPNDLNVLLSFVELSGYNLNQALCFHMDFLNHGGGGAYGFLSGFPPFSFTVYRN